MLWGRSVYAPSKKPIAAKSNRSNKDKVAVTVRDKCRYRKADRARLVTRAATSPRAAEVSNVLPSKATGHLNRDNSSHPGHNSPGVQGQKTNKNQGDHARKATNPADQGRKAREGRPGRRTRDQGHQKTTTLRLQHKLKTKKLPVQELFLLVNLWKRIRFNPDTLLLNELALLRFRGEEEVPDQR